MAAYSRYSIFYVPAASDSRAQFGARWLGWDLNAGSAVAHLDLKNLPQDIATLTKRPRKYGFHGTLKAPFRLAESQSEKELMTAVHAFCETRKPIDAGGFELALLGRFLAFVPKHQSAELQDLARDVVIGFDRYSAPLSEDDLMRRHKQKLSQQQEEYLQRWGYPHVLDAFRFHMTLSGSFGVEELLEVQKQLSPIVAPLLDAPWIIDALSVCGEREDGNFEVIERVPFGG